MRYPLWGGLYLSGRGIIIQAVRTHGEAADDQSGHYNSGTEAAHSKSSPSRRFHFCLQRLWQQSGQPRGKGLVEGRLVHKVFLEVFGMEGAIKVFMVIGLPSPIFQGLGTMRTLCDLESLAKGNPLKTIKT